MAQLVIRNLENAVKIRLQRRARRHGRSMEKEVRNILRAATIASLFANSGLKNDVAELHGHTVKVASFD